MILCIILEARLGYARNAKIFRGVSDEADAFGLNYESCGSLFQ